MTGESPCAPRSSPPSTVPRSRSSSAASADHTSTRPSRAEATSASRTADDAAGSSVPWESDEKATAAISAKIASCRAGSGSWR